MLCLLRTPFLEGCVCYDGWDWSRSRYFSTGDAPEPCLQTLPLPGGEINSDYGYVVTCPDRVLETAYCAVGALSLLGVAFVAALFFAPIKRQQAAPMRAAHSLLPGILLYLDGVYVCIQAYTMDVFPSGIILCKR